MFTSVILLLLSALPMILQGFGIVSPKLTTELEALAQVIPNLIASFTSGKGVTNDAVAALEAIQTELQAQVTAGVLTAAQEAQATALVQDIGDALEAEGVALAKTDPSQLPTNLPTDL